MSFLARLFGAGSQQKGVDTLRATPSNHLGVLHDPDSSSNVSVTRIENGFLVTTRLFNPNGPDSITAHYAADVEALSALITVKLTHQRLTK